MGRPQAAAAAYEIIGLVVLWHAQWIVVTRRKVGLKIFFDVVFGAHRPRNFLQIVRAADFVQIDKPVRLLNNGKAGFYVDSFEIDQCGYS